MDGRPEVIVVAILLVLLYQYPCNAVHFSDTRVFL